MKNRLFQYLMIFFIFLNNSPIEAQTIDFKDVGLNKYLINEMYKVTKLIVNGQEENSVPDSKIFELRSEGVMVVYESLDPWARKSIEFVNSVINMGSGKWKFSFKSGESIGNPKEFVLIERKEGYFSKGSEKDPQVISIEMIDSESNKIKIILEKVDLLGNIERIDKYSLEQQWKSKYTETYLRRTKANSMKQ